MCANRMNAEASISEIRVACGTPFFKRAISGADFEGQPFWKRVALLFLKKGWYSLFRAYCRLLFGVLGMIGSSKVDRYC